MYRTSVVVIGDSARRRLSLLAQRCAGPHQTRHVCPGSSCGRWQRRGSLEWLQSCTRCLHEFALGVVWRTSKAASSAPQPLLGNLQIVRSGRLRPARFLSSHPHISNPRRALCLTLPVTQRDSVDRRSPRPTFGPARLNCLVRSAVAGQGDRPAEEAKVRRQPGQSAESAFAAPIGALCRRTSARMGSPPPADTAKRPPGTHRQQSVYLGGRRALRIDRGTPRDVRHQEVRPALTLISSPECVVAAAITDRSSLASTHGPVAHVVLGCSGSHLPDAVGPVAVLPSLPAPHWQRFHIGPRKRGLVPPALWSPICCARQ